MKRKRYRTIGGSTCSPDAYINNYRLLGGIWYYEGDIRIEIPDSIKIKKLSCDTYSKIENKMRVKDFNPTVIHYGKYNKDLTKLWLDNKIEPHEFSDYCGNFDYYMNRKSIKGRCNIKSNDGSRPYLGNYKEEYPTFVYTRLYYHTIDNVYLYSIYEVKEDCLICKKFNRKTKETIEDYIIYEDEFKTLISGAF